MRIKGEKGALRGDRRFLRGGVEIAKGKWQEKRRRDFIWRVFVHCGIRNGANVPNLINEWKANYFCGKRPIRQYVNSASKAEEERKRDKWISIP